ncbi:MAG: NAD(P)-dependent glycerol-3-phosphate dehydrogenase [Oscillospiraceae bacterium]|jgi:glycerol-3-phosphate dehydrogenase (NAD(P)+)|nr:NAD(P)-dependent glycerol-3-phosphate dehydrogenase [Oscillospiraceae bacterium]
MAKIAVLGCGFGAALAALWCKAGHKVTAWTKFQDEIDAIKRDGENKKLLPGVKLPPEINFTADISEIRGCDILVFAIPSDFVRETAQKAAEFVTPETILLNVGKGFERGTLKRQSEVISETLPNNPIAVLTGPCHAEEVGRGVPTTVVCACNCGFQTSAYYIQDTLQTESMRIYLSDDVIGCELGGALKNTIALCCGIALGMGLGANSIAAIMTRGLAEITRLSVALGARWQTFTGLAGIGDLIVTCTSELSRNHRAGKLIGSGLSASETVEEVGTVEGYGSARSAMELAEMYNVEVPIIEQLCKILFEGIKPAEALKALMSRPSTHEREEYWDCCEQ